MNRTTFLIALAFGLAISSSSFAQTFVDVVHLKNGSVIRGTIVEQVPGVSLKVQTADGSIFVYALDEVEKMTKEQIEVEMNAEPTQPRKSPGSALAWSLLVGGFTPINGAGQFYNGEVGKGFLFMLAGLVGTGMMIDGFETDDFGEFVAGATVRLTSYIWASVDAPRSAKKINLRRGWTTALEPPASSVYFDLAPSGKGRGGMLAFTHRM